MFAGGARYPFTFQRKTDRPFLDERAFIWRFLPAPRKYCVATNPWRPAMESKRMKSMSHSRGAQRGQGMSEYIIITALVAVAGIGLFAAFGDVLQNQMAGMSREMAGQSATQDITDAQASATTAQNRAAQADSLSTYNQQTNAAQ
jgi:hypothetical protein